MTLKWRKLRDERRVVHRARRPDWQALRREGLAHDGSQISKRDLDRTSPFDVRATAETIVLILLATVRVRLRLLLSTTQLRHQQIGRCPREEQTDDCMDDDVPAKGSHWCQDTRLGLIGQIGRIRSLAVRPVFPAHGDLPEGPRLAPCRNDAQLRASTGSRSPTRAENRPDSIRRERRARLRR